MFLMHKVKECKLISTELIESYFVQIQAFYVVEIAEKILNDCACEVSSKDGGWFD